MNKYGMTALDAVTEYKRRPHAGPRAAWEAASSRIFGAGTPSQKKSCPRDAFLGLCEAGAVVGIPAGSYTRSRKNKRYALDALTILRQRPSLARDPQRLWELVMRGVEKRPNSQMEVVAALWETDLLS